MTIGVIFYFIAALVLLTAGFDIVDFGRFDAWQIAAGLTLLGVIFQGVALPTTTIVHKE